MKKTIPAPARSAVTSSLVLVLALGLAAQVANADFTFGTPTNLGQIVNGSDDVVGVSISADGLELYFASDRPGGHGSYDLWVTTRATTNDDWGEPINLGPIVNSQYACMAPSISADGLSLFFSDWEYGLFLPGGVGSTDTWMVTRETKDAAWSAPVNVGRPVNYTGGDLCPTMSADGLSLYFASGAARGGSGLYDLWVTTRVSTSDPWGEPVNLGSSVNSSAAEMSPSLSADSLTLFFCRTFTGQSDFDLWMTTWSTENDEWLPTVKLAAPVNTSAVEAFPSISADGSTLYFCSDMASGSGQNDIWQVSIEPVVDFNGDGIVDALDICIMADHWHTDYQLCDIGPMPWGDGIVDVQDLIVLAEHFEKITPNEEVHVDANDADGQVELEQGQVLVVTLESNPTTGYRWEVAEIQESILEQMGEAEFKPSQTGEPPIVGAGGWEIFRFKAISAGQMTLKLVYRRSWEEGVEPINTFSIEVVVN